MIKIIPTIDVTEQELTLSTFLVGLEITEPHQREAWLQFLKDNDDVCAAFISMIFAFRDFKEAVDHHRACLKGQEN